MDTYPYQPTNQHVENRINESPPNEDSENDKRGLIRQKTMGDCQGFGK